MEFSDIEEGMVVRVKTFEQLKEYYYVVNAKGWAWRPEWLVPIKTIANNIDIEKVNDLI